MSQARFASPLQPRASARHDPALQRRDRRQHDRVEHKQRSETPITVGMGRDQLLAASAPPPGPELAHAPTSPRSASRPQAASAEPPRHVLRGKSATGAGGEWWTSWQTKLAPAERSGRPLGCTQTLAAHMRRPAARRLVEGRGGDPRCARREEAESHSAAKKLDPEACLSPNFSEGKNRAYFT